MLMVFLTTVPWGRIFGVVGSAFISVMNKYEVFTRKATTFYATALKSSADADSRLKKTSCPFHLLVILGMK